MLEVAAKVIACHKKIGFQFSGGRDSTAALHVLKPVWSRLSIYTLDTGDAWPETVAVINRMQEIVGREFITIRADVHRYRREIGWPSDVVPVNATAPGRALHGSTEKIVSGFDCCAANIMLPMHRRMLDDGITLIVRGTRADEFVAPPTRSGDTDGVVELLFPIEGWTADQVDAYIARHGLPTSPIYADGAQHGGNCLRCTAYWDDASLPYLRRNHPVIYGEVIARIERHGAAVIQQFRPLYEGIEE